MQASVYTHDFRLKLSNEHEEKEVYYKHYRSMIGILLNVTSLRTYIMQALGLATKFQETPKETHVQDVKLIFIYLKGTLDFHLWYPHSGNLTLVAYTKAD